MGNYLLAIREETEYGTVDPGVFEILRATNGSNTADDSLTNTENLDGSGSVADIFSSIAQTGSFTLTANAGWGDHDTLHQLHYNTSYAAPLSVVATATIATGVAIDDGNGNLVAGGVTITADTPGDFAPLATAAAAATNGSAKVFLKIAGAAAADTNDWMRVIHTVSEDVIEIMASQVTGLAASAFAPIVAEAAVALTLQVGIFIGEKAKAPKSFSYMLFDCDYDRYAIFRGCTVNTLDFSLSAKGPVEWTFNCLWAAQGNKDNPGDGVWLDALPDDVTLGTPGETGPTIRSNSQLQWAAFDTGSQLIRIECTSLLALTWSSNRGQALETETAGCDYATGVDEASYQVTGTHSVKIEASAAITELGKLGHLQTPCGLIMQFIDLRGRYFMITIPQIKLPQDVHAGGGPGDKPTNGNGSFASKHYPGFTLDRPAHMFIQKMESTIL